MSDEFYQIVRGGRSRVNRRNGVAKVTLDTRIRGLPSDRVVAGRIILLPRTRSSSSESHRDWRFRIRASQFSARRAVLCLA